MKRFLSKTRMILIMCFCVLLITVSFADGAPSVYQLDFSYVELNHVSGTLLTRKDNQYQVYTPDGQTALSAEYPDAYVEDMGFFKVRDSDGLNNSGLLDGNGSIVMPTVYGEIEVISDRWQAGIVLKSATADNYDYKGPAGSFYLIDRVDLFFRGTPAGSLDRLHWKDAYACGDYLQVRNRDESYTWYDKELHQSPVDGYAYLEYDNNYLTGDIVHMGSGQKAFCAECTLREDEVDRCRDFREGNIVDLQGNVLCHLPDCDPVTYLTKGNWIGVRDRKGKYGYIDLTGKRTVPCEYEYIDTLDDSFQYTGYAYAVKDGKGGFVNLRTGEETGFEYNDKALQRYAGFLTVEDLDGSIIVVCAGTGTLPGRYTKVTANSMYSGTANPTAILQDAEGRCGVISCLGEWLLPMGSEYEPVSGVYSSTSVSDDGTVILTRKEKSSGSSQYEYTSLIFEKAPDPAENRDEESLNTGVITDETPAPADPDESWTCENGHEGNTGKFCSECGAPKPTPAPAPAEAAGTWTCENGHEGNTGKFCAECGAPKPAGDQGPWTCENGHEGNTGKFCAECGAPRP